MKIKKKFKNDLINEKLVEKRKKKKIKIELLNNCGKIILNVEFCMLHFPCMEVLQFSIIGKLGFCIDSLADLLVEGPVALILKYSSIVEMHLLPGEGLSVRHSASHDVVVFCSLKDFSTNQWKETGSALSLALEFKVHTSELSQKSSLITLFSLASV